MKALLLATLLALGSSAYAEMKVSAKETLEGTTVTITGATREDVRNGSYEETLRIATTQARA